MFTFIKQAFITLLILVDHGLENLNDEPRLARPTLIDLNSDELISGLCHYPFMIRFRQMTDEVVMLLMIHVLKWNKILFTLFCE